MNSFRNFLIWIGTVLKIISKFLTFRSSLFLDEGIPYFRQVAQVFHWTDHHFFLNLLHISWRRFFMTYKLSVGRILWHDDIFGLPTWCLSYNWLVPTLLYLPWFLKIYQCNRRISTVRNFFPRLLIFTFVLCFKNLFFICFVVSCNDGSNTDLYPHNKSQKLFSLLILLVKIDGIKDWIP